MDKCVSHRSAARSRPMFANEHVCRVPCQSVMHIVNGADQKLLYENIKLLYIVLY